MTKMRYIVMIERNIGKTDPVSFLVISKDERILTQRQDRTIQTGIDTNQRNLQRARKTPRLAPKYMLSFAPFIFPLHFVVVFEVFFVGYY